MTFARNNAMLKTIKVAVAAVAITAVCAGSAYSQEITGAGATFPAPVYAKWAEAYQKATGVKMNYQSIGSSGGIRQITAKTVDFGATDAPLSQEQLAKDGLMQFPAVIGGVVPVVNVAEVKPGEMRLTGQVLGDIFLGKITKWNDKAIAELNPKLKLPAQDIAVVRRADGSGTTFIFTNYLSKVNAEWKSKIGEGQAVQWPSGMGGKGNEGVAAFVQRLPGAIGYVEYAYAKQNKLAHTLLKNLDGQFVAPDDLTFKAAAAGADWNKAAFGAILTEQPGKASWPITGATFILLHTAQAKPAQGNEVMKFFDWSFANGSKLATDMDYVPLPDTLTKQIKGVWAAQVKDAAGKAIWTAK
jgi:phosphate transport system substrate-binding protein